MSNRLSTDIIVSTEEGDDIAEFTGILLDDVQPLINLIRHHGVETENNNYRFVKTQFWLNARPAFYVTVMADV